MAPNFNRLWTSDTGRPLSESELIAITQFPYRTVIALQGKIVYLDIDNGEHVTEWCMYFDPTVNDVLVHTNGNYMD